MPRTLTGKPAEMLQRYPPFLRAVPLVQAVCAAIGGEMDLQGTMIDELERNLIPATADVHLDLWESQLGLTVAPPGLDTAQRRNIVVAYLSVLAMDGSGVSWEANATRVLGTSGWSYQTNIPGDASTPPPHVIRLSLPYAPGSLQATVATSLLRAITPAADQLQVGYSQGFILDVSVLDNDPLG